jgi:hypothetical protein
MEVNTPVQLSNAVTPMIRPALIVDEWWDSYVGRALAANGFSVGSGYILQKFEHAIEDFIGDSLANMHRIEYMDDEVRCKFGPFVIPNWAVRGPRSSVPICRHCLATSPHIPMGWRLRSTLTCPTHKTVLNEVCPKCERQWYAHDCGRGRCRCGLDIRKAECPETISGTSVDTWSLQSQANRSAFGGLVESQSEFDSDNPGEKLACQILMHRVVAALKSVHVNVLGPNGASVRTRTFTPKDDLSTDPSSFSKLWQSLNSAAHLGMAISAICEIHHNEKSSPTLLSTLPLWEFAKELADLGANTSRVEHKGWVKVGDLTSGFVPLKDAARRAGIASATLQTLERRGIVGPEKVLQVGDQLFLYSAQQIEELAKFRGGEGFGAGLRPRELKVFRNAGLVELLGDGLGAQWLDPEGITNLTSSLELVSLPISSIQCVLFRLSESRIWNWNNIEVLPTFFKKLKSAEIAVFSDGSSGGFSRFYVDGDAIGWLIHEARKYSGTCHESTLQSDFFECEIKSQRKLTRSQMQSTNSIGGFRRKRSSKFAQAELWC